MSFSFSSLRVKLIILVLIVVMPLFGLIIYMGFGEHAHFREMAMQNALSLAQHISAHQEDLVNNAHDILFFVSQMMDEHQHSLETFTKMFARLSPRTPQLTGLLIAEADGEVIARTYPTDQKLNISDQLIYLRVLQTKDFVIGEYQVSRLTGKPILTLALPVLDKAGAVKKIIATEIDLNYVDSVIDKRTFPAGTHVNIFDHNGTVLFRYPDPGNYVGKMMPQADVIREALRKKEGIIEGRGMDGNVRLHGFTSFGQPAGTVYVSVGIPPEVAFAQVNRAFVQRLIGLIVFTGLVLTLARFWGEFFILRIMRRLLGAAQRVASGDLHMRVGAPYGRGEVGQLAKGFDLMVEELEQREAETKEAVKAVHKKNLDLAAILDNLPFLAWLKDKEGRFIMVNEPFARSCCGSTSVNDLIGKTDLDIWPQHLAEAYRADDFEVLRTRQKKAVEEVVSDQSSEKWFETYKAPLFDVNGNVTGTTGFSRDITDRKQKDQQIQTQLARLAALHEIDLAITGSRDLRTTLKVILEQVTGQLAVDAALILLYEHHSLMLEFAVERGFQTPALQHTRLKIGEGLAGRAALERRRLTVNIPDAADYMEQSPLLAKEGFQTHIAVPLIAKGHVIGVLEIFQRSPLTPNQDWMEFLEALATQTAIAINDASQFDDLERSNIELMLAYDTTLEGWSRALDLRDRETEGHSQRVTEMTVRLARALRIPDSEIPHIRRGALLHDIGKMGIPDSILLKPGPLSDAEWEIMRRHPMYAYELLRPINFLRLAIYIPYHHHEKWDGTGYPRGLKGEAIQMAARIFAIVDVWDALISERPYRPAWAREKVLAHIKQESGKSFDPQVVEAFIELIQNT